MHISNDILRNQRLVVLFLLMTGLGLGLSEPTPGLAQNTEEGQNSPRPEVAYATRSDTTIPLRHLPQIPPLPAVLGEVFERPRKLLPNREGTATPAPGVVDPVLQGPAAEVGAPTSGANFAGLNNVNGVLPPDPSGAIGPNHYVQVVNLSFKIWDRNGNALLGPSNINTLWQGFGGPCQSTNDGDPVVLYDHLADRWMMSQFALPNYPRGPFYQCIAVSQTADPTGPWHRYEFTISQSKLNDYPKFGVWPDGYYMTINQFKCKFINCSWAGQGVVAFERNAMLNGAAARMVFFDLQSVDPNLGGMLPSDLDGPAPPAGTPNYFVQVDDNAWGYSGDQLQIWEFHVDWANTGASTFTHVTPNLPTASFDSNLCGYARNCIPQPGGTKVDAISDRLMYRLQYRNFGSYQTLVTNHSVDVNGSDRAGIRWYELRNSGGGWGIQQQGTYSPDSTHRWMGSIAMNGQGDIALGYSKSSISVSPSIYATGHLASDAAGVMTQAEIPIINGSGYQTHSSGRWGDYSQMTVDPTDDCAFWYTQEYYAGVSSASWQTRIGSFKLRDCGLVNPVHDVAVTGVSAPSPVLPNFAQSVSVNLANNGTASETFSVSLTDSLAAQSIAPQNVNLGAGSTTTIFFSWYPTVKGNHVLTATAATVSGETHTSDNANSATSTVRNAGDVAITNISPPSSVAQGTSTNVLVTVMNQGDVTDSFTVSLTDTPPSGGSAGTVSASQSVTLAAGSNTTLTFTWNTSGASAGTHVLTATASTVFAETDTADNSMQANSEVTQSAGATSVHVAVLDGSASTQGPKKWKATVTITIFDNTGAAVANAAVSGSWSGAANGSASCTTGSTGQCSVTQNNIPNGSGNATYSVDSVTAAGLGYNSSANTASSVIISQP